MIMQPVIMRQLAADHIRKYTRKQKMNTGQRGAPGPAPRAVRATEASGQRDAR
jgi:hypothetical protein